MKKWERFQVKDIFSIGRGRVINQIEIKNNPGEYPVYSSQSMNNGEMGKISSYDFEGEYVTWTTDGAYAGTVFYRSGKFNCTNVCGTLKPKDSEQVDCKFAAEYLGLIAKKHVSYCGNPKLMNNVFAEIEIEVPPIKEQKKIAEILTSVDDVIELTEKEIEKLQMLKKGMMQELLTKGIGHTKFKDSPLGKIPESWSVEKLGDSSKFSQGVQVDLELQFKEPSKGRLRFLRIVDYTQSTSDLRFISEEAAKKGLVEKDDVVMVRYGASTGFIGRGIEGAIANNMFTITPNSSISKKFLYHYLKQDFVGELISNVTAGSAMPAINFGIVSDILIKIPNTQDEQLKIVEIVEKMDAKIDVKRMKLGCLSHLKKALMQDLLTGKVRVGVEK